MFSSLVKILLFSNAMLAVSSGSASNHTHLAASEDHEQMFSPLMLATDDSQDQMIKDGDAQVAKTKNAKAARDLVIKNAAVTKKINDKIKTYSATASANSKAASIETKIYNYAKGKWEAWTYSNNATSHTSI